MSDLEDLDHELEATPPEEELSAPADNPAGGAAKGSSDPMKTIDRSVLMKAAAVVVVVVGGGAYFMMSSHHAPPKQADVSLSPLSHHAATSHMASPVMPSQQAGANSQAWNGNALSPSAPAPPAIVSGPGSNNFLPAAIPPLPQGAAMTAPASPPIVNEVPPPSAQLTNVGGAASPQAIPPSAAPGSIPGMPPPAVPSMPSPPPFAAPSTFSPTASAPGSGQPQLQPPVKAPALKKGEPMPSVAIPSVDEAEINKTGINTVSGKTGFNGAGSPSPAAQTAKVEELQKKIDDLEKTITQLQQAAVVKEDAAENSAEQEVPVTAFKQEHKSSHHHHKAKHVPKSRHTVAVKWVLKAAKPGVAWVAPKGSDDLHMVETGDSLTGIGKVTSIIMDSSGYWVVNGTKGRISQ